MVTGQSEVICCRPGGRVSQDGDTWCRTAFWPSMFSVFRAPRCGWSCHREGRGGGEKRHSHTEDASCLAGYQCALAPEQGGALFPKDIAQPSLPSKSCQEEAAQGSLSLQAHYPACLPFSGRSETTPRDLKRKRLAKLAEVRSVGRGPLLAIELLVCKWIKCSSAAAGITWLRFWLRYVRMRSRTIRGKAHPWLRATPQKTNSGRTQI